MKYLVLSIFYFICIIIIVFLDIFSDYGDQGFSLFHAAIAPVMLGAILFIELAERYTRK